LTGRQSKKRTARSGGTSPPIQLRFITIETDAADRKAGGVGSGPQSTASRHIYKYDGGPARIQDVLFGSMSNRQKEL